MRWKIDVHFRSLSLSKGSGSTSSPTGVGRTFISHRSCNAQHFEADTGNTTGSRVRVTGRKGAEGCREATEALEAQDGEVQPNRHAQKQRSH